MLDRVREAFRHDVVDAGFDALVEALRRSSDDLDREGRAARERPEGGLEPVVAEHGRMKPARELAQLLERELQLLAERRKDCSCGRGILLQAFLGDPQLHGEGDEALLGAVVEIALEPPPLGQSGSTMRAREAVS